MDRTQLQHLKLAFVLDHVHRIVDADGTESYEEFRMMGEILPRPLLRDAGFLSDEGMLTPTYEAARDEALRVLPTQTDDAEKVDLFQLLYAASAVDELVAEEVKVLHQAGAALGFDTARITTLMATFAAEE